MAPIECLLHQEDLLEEVDAKKELLPGLIAKVILMHRPRIVSKEAAGQWQRVCFACRSS